MSAPLLVELFTEELPPKALKALGSAFAQGVVSGLAKRELAANGASFRWFATPRRLAVLVADVKDASEPRAIEVKLMPVSVGLDAAGKADSRARQEARRHRARRCRSRDLQEAHGREVRDTLPRRQDAVGAARAGLAGIDRRGDRGAAHPESDELPARRRPHHRAVRAARARPGRPAWRRRRCRARARARRGARDARPSLPGRARHPALEREGVRGAVARPRPGDRRLRGAQGRDPPPARRRGGQGGSHAGRGGGDLRAAGRGDGAGGNADGLRRRLRGRVPRGARRVPRAHDAPEPEVFPAVRRRRQAHQPLPHREQHESGGSVEHRGRQRARGPPAPRRRALLLRDRQEGEARRARAAARRDRLPQQAGQPARSRGPAGHAGDEDPGVVAARRRRAWNGRFAPPTSRRRTWER